MEIRLHVQIVCSLHEEKNPDEEPAAAYTADLGFHMHYKWVFTFSEALLPIIHSSTYLQENVNGLSLLGFTKIQSLCIQPLGNNYCRYTYLSIWLIQF